MEILCLLSGAVLAYLLGSFSSAVWIGRWFYGKDVRKEGSGNAGTTNTIRVLGWKPGVVVLILDAFKGWCAMVKLMAEPQYNVDGGAFWGSWIGLVLLAMVYCAVGVFGSSVTNSQIVAFVVSAIVCFLLYYGFELIGTLMPGNVAYTLRLFGINAHYSSMSRGVIDSRDMVYYAMVAALFVCAAVRTVSHRR